MVSDSQVVDSDPNYIIVMHRGNAFVMETKDVNGNDLNASQIYYRLLIFRKSSFLSKNLDEKCTYMSVAQSICTQYSCFENMGRFVTWKKRSKRWVAKTGYKNRVIVTQKEKRQPGLATHILDLFLKFQILKKYQADLIN